MQSNWVGRSEGARVRFPLVPQSGSAATTGQDIEVFTTRIDTIYGANFIVLAPEHPLVREFAESSPDPDAFRAKAAADVDLRTAAAAAAQLRERAALWLERVATEVEAGAFGGANDHTRAFFVSRILREPAQVHRTRAAELRGISMSDYVRQVTVAQARKEVEAAGGQTIVMTPEEQLAFWNALSQPAKLTAAQKRLGKLMRGES